MYFELRPIANQRCQVTKFNSNFLIGGVIWHFLLAMEAKSKYLLTLSHLYRFPFFRKTKFDIVTLNNIFHSLFQIPRGIGTSFNEVNIISCLLSSFVIRGHSQIMLERQVSYLVSQMLTQYPIRVGRQVKNTHKTSDIICECSLIHTAQE